MPKPIVEEVLVYIPESIKNCSFIYVQNTENSVQHCSGSFLISTFERCVFNVVNLLKPKNHCVLLSVNVNESVKQNIKFSCYQECSRGFFFNWKKHF